MLTQTLHGLGVHDPRQESRTIDLKLDSKTLQVWERAKPMGALSKPSLRYPA